MIVTLILLLLIFIVGVVFFRFSKKHNKNIFLYTALGVFSFIAGIAVYIFLYIYFLDQLSRVNRYLHECLCFITGGLFSTLYYFFLKKKWKVDKYKKRGKKFSLNDSRIK